jgi:hypothetical protein
MKILAKIQILSVIAFTALLTQQLAAQTAPVPGNTPIEKATNYDQGFRLGFGVSPGYVFDDPYEFGLGGDVRLQYDLSKRYSITLTTGFTNLFIDGKNNDLGFIPAKAGFKAFFWEDQFYAMGEAGAGFAVTNNYDDTTLILSPSIGYANKWFDISLRYEHYSEFPIYTTNSIFGGTVSKGTGQLGLRIAYGFKL